LHILCSLSAHLKRKEKSNTKLITVQHSLERLPVKE
jgi:hypothetical protein